MEMEILIPDKLATSSPLSDTKLELSSSCSWSPANSSGSSTIRNHGRKIRGRSHFSKDADPGKIIQVLNVSPRVKTEQLKTLFEHLGRIEDLRLYPTADFGMQIQTKICFIKFSDSASVGKAQHLTNTVFIDRAMIVIPHPDDEIPDELRALELLANGNLFPGMEEPKLPQHVTSQLEGLPPNQVVVTKDPYLLENNLPPYPPLSQTFDPRKIEEIRRTVLVCNIDPQLTADELMSYFSLVAGEIKYFRFCSRDNDPIRYALIEFTEQPSVLEALKINGMCMGKDDYVIRVYHSTQSIIKPQAKTNDAAQREIEEAVSKQEILSQDLETTVAALTKRTRRSRSRSRSRSRRSRSRSRWSSRSSSCGRRRSRSRSRRRRRSPYGRVKRNPSRSRWRSRSRSRETTSRRKSKRSRSRTRSHSRKKSSKRRSRRNRSRSDSRPRRSRSRSRSRSTRKKQRKSGRKEKSKNRDKKEDKTETETDGNDAASSQNSLVA